MKAGILAGGEDCPSLNRPMWAQANVGSAWRVGISRLICLLEHRFEA
jgi:hypothetical protein